MVLRSLDIQFREMFSQVGPVLMDFAERAENDELQGRFFEALGLLRNRRADIEHTFRLELNQGFDQFLRYGRLPNEDVSAASADGIELSLVAPEDMEESVACENLIQRANANYFPDLYALAQRLSVVNGGHKLKDSQIPASPHHLVWSFRHAIDSLDIEAKIKIVLYALFDRFVVRHLGEVYDGFNEQLKDAGILPNLKAVAVRSPGGQGTTTRSARDKVKGSEPSKGDEKSTEPGGPPSLATELFDSILGLMAGRRPGGQTADAGARALNTPTSPELLNAINLVQSSTRSSVVASGGSVAATIPTVEIDAAFLERVKDTLTQERRQVVEQVGAENLSPVDADLIDLIGMLFEYMLNDPVLPNSAKALLSHLHTPYLKVAMVDRRLLVDTQHPARRLLDQMIEAGSLWVEEGNPNRGIFPAMQKTVDRVLLEFTDNIELFNELLEFFEEAMQEQRRRIETMEQRSQETARGRERLQLARQQAVEEIRTLCSAHPVPRVVGNFLGKVWTDHLVFILLREPQPGDAWHKAVATAKELVAMFDPRDPKPADRRQPEHIRALRGTIVEQTQGTDDVNRAALNALLALLDQPPETWNRSEMIAAGQVESSKATDREASNEVGLPPSRALAEDENDEEGLSSEEKEIVERLRKMRFGTWFELTPEADGKTRRIKLSWMSPLTSTCMFVDRSGMQAEIKSLRELAQEILAGRAKIIPPPKHPFIDRALVSIRKMLQAGDRGKTDTAT